MQTNIQGWLGMRNLAQICINQIIEAICSSPSQAQLWHILGVRQSNENMASWQEKQKQ